MPLYYAIASPMPAALGPLDYAGLVLFTIGLVFEAAGDEQLRRFKADPANQGKVLNTGLWRYTRHPNYFGEAVLWWGLGLIGAATPGGYVALVGPAIMTYLLLRISGVALLEKTLVETKPGYTDYVRRTSAFFPRPPRATTSSS
jgi:steroid 5-alpha reductase family enzyme